MPTRRELASYGIKLPSQRIAEEKAREAERNQYETGAQLTDEEIDAMHQDELARQFAQSQQHRYGETYQHDTQQAEDDDTAAEAELARQFAASQQQRYSGEQPAGAQPFSLDDLDFSPMKVLVDEGPHEPLFTLGVMPESTPVQQPVAPQPQYQQPQQPVAPQPQYQQPQQPVASQPQYQQPQQPVAPQPQYQQPQQPVAPQPQYQQPQQPVAPQPQYQQPQQPVAPQPQYQQPQQPVAPQPQYQQPQQPTAPQDSLIHPLLMRNGDSRPLQRPTTPLPSLDLLTPPPSEVEPVDTFALEQMARLVEARLADFRIKADVVNYSPARSLLALNSIWPRALKRRVSPTFPGSGALIVNGSRTRCGSHSSKPYVGLELPNKKRQTVYLREVLDNAKFRENPSPLTVVLGKDIAGDPVVADLAKMPHLLVAGTTGSGKSVGVNAMILSMLYKAQPEDVRFIMIDPKMLELSVYEGIPHLLTEVVTDMKDAANALRWSVNEMERRYKLMSALGVRNLAGYNEKIAEAARMGRPIPTRTGSRATVWMFSIRFWKNCRISWYWLMNLPT